MTITGYKFGFKVVEIKTGENIQEVWCVNDDGRRRILENWDNDMNKDLEEEFDM